MLAHEAALFRRPRAFVIKGGRCQILQVRAEVRLFVKPEIVAAFFEQEIAKIGSLFAFSRRDALHRRTAGPWE